MKVDRITHSRDMVIQNFPRWRAAESWIWYNRSKSIRYPRSQKPHPRIKHEVDRMICCRDMAIWNFPRWWPAAVLDLVQPEVGPFDSPSSKTYRRTKHEVDRMTRCRDMAVRNFPKSEVGRSFVSWSVVGWLSVLNIYIVIMYSSSLR